MKLFDVFGVGFPRNACIDLTSGSLKSNNVLKFHAKRFECRVTDLFGLVGDRLLGGQGKTILKENAAFCLRKFQFKFQYR